MSKMSKMKFYFDSVISGATYPIFTNGLDTFLNRTAPINWEEVEIKWLYRFEIKQRSYELSEYNTRKLLDSKLMKILDEVVHMIPRDNLAKLTDSIISRAQELNEILTLIVEFNELSSEYNEDATLEDSDE